ncbi:hypothetical protein E1293_19985 [Actinomadura darangshiensis]|uniref:Uncharacterized protein n=1 Tax=Actinomadura darangshiensis TaxID=705336 RepID=A0A4R5B679_9ACTN|nr:hypothetical protein [Actinomadura darangshiensis]TDD80825.1 hypothetical protein E1293_19985 [Actinomadura darangshiensis]
MTGDLGSDAGRARSRPSFLPPVDGYPPQYADPAGPAPAADPPRRGTAWIAAVIAAASALLVSAFLPWARAQVVVDLFGRSLSRDLGSVAGIDADDMVLAVPVLAVVAIALAAWDLIDRDARIGALAAIPGMLALLVCGIFVLRLGHVRDDLPETGLDLGYQITVRYGWYLAVVTSLFVVGFSLARPIGERVAKSQRQPEQDYSQYPHADPQYAERQYSSGEYAAWPSEDQAWGRQDQEEPGKDQRLSGGTTPQQEHDRPSSSAPDAGQS